MPERLDQALLAVTPRSPQRAGPNTTPQWRNGARLNRPFNPFRVRERSQARIPGGTPGFEATKEEKRK